MAKKVLKLIVVMALMTVLWVLILGLMVTANPPWNIGRYVFGILMLLILFWYTYMMIKPYVWEVCNKYSEMKKPKAFYNPKFDMGVLNRYLNTK